MKFKVGDRFVTTHPSRGDWIYAEVEGVGDSYYEGRSTSDGGETWWDWTDENEFDDYWRQVPDDYDMWADYVAWRLTQ